MIKAKELKPDNFIYFKNPLTNDDKRIVVIDSVKKSIGSFQEKHDHGIDIWLPLIYCDGIPLTPEWLERCGLVFNADEGYYSVDLPNRPYGITAIKVGAGIFLHQLQNLYFALTGVELQIKLP